MHVRLNRIGADGSGRSIDVSKSKFLIGRSEECHLRAKNSEVSRRHCLLAIAGPKVTIRDLGSRHGTFLNGQRLEKGQDVEVASGDRLLFSNFEFEIIVDRSADKSASAGPGTAPISRTGTKKMAPADPIDETDLEVSSWLEQADEVDREIRKANPDVRQVQITASESSSDSAALEEDEPQTTEEKPKKSNKKEWGKLPKIEKDPAASSGDAAKKALGELGEAMRRNKK